MLIVTARPITALFPLQCNSSVALGSFLRGVVSQGPVSVGLIEAGCTSAAVLTSEVSSFYNFTQVRSGTRGYVVMVTSAILHLILAITLLYPLILPLPPMLHLPPHNTLIPSKPSSPIIEGWRKWKWKWKFFF